MQMIQNMCFDTCAKPTFYVTENPHQNAHRRQKLFNFSSNSKRWKNMFLIRQMLWRKPFSDDCSDAVPGFWSGCPVKMRRSQVQLYTPWLMTVVFFLFVWSRWSHPPPPPKKKIERLCWHSSGKSLSQKLNTTKDILFEIYSQKHECFHFSFQLQPGFNHKKTQRPCQD